MFLIFFEFINQLIDKYNLFYIDIHLRNIGISNNKIKFLDIDECKSINKKEDFDDYKLITYDNLSVIIMQIILDEIEINNKLYDFIDYLFPITKDRLELLRLEQFINNYNSDVSYELKKKYYKK